MIRVVSAIILTLAIVISAQAQPAPENLIRPGESIGRFRLDWTVARFRTELGPENETGSFNVKALTNPTSFAVQYYFWNQGVEVITKAGNTVAVNLHRIARVTPNLQYRTAEGIGLSSTKEEVEATYGKPTYQFTADWALVYIYETGLVVWFNKFESQKKVEVISVWKMDEFR
ncbi:MAG: hypothetical protein HYS57_00345 [Parcubacteria group bacterium]|nr:hypothetical protein [Parcubacteria group bacterium]